MFNKYWREFPWFLQLIFYVMTVFICGVFFMVLGMFLVPALTGVGITEIPLISVDSSPNVRVAFFLYQGIIHAGLFGIPVILFALATTPRPLDFLGIRKPGNSLHWPIVILMIIGAVPMISGIAGLFDMLPLTESLQTSKEKFMAQQKAYMHLTTPAEFWAALPVMGIIPAIGEELLFRSLMMRYAAKKMVGNIFWPIMLTSVLFALVHGNVVGFPSLLVAGLILAYVYYLTRSVVMSMVAHFIVNGSQVMLIYFGRNSEEVTRMMDTNETPWGLFIGGTVLFIAGMYMLWRTRTPLPANWTDDFTPEERAQQAEQNNML